VVGQLLASQRVTNVVNFPTAAPGVANASGDNPVVMRNTGNVVLSLAVTAYDVQGRTNASNVLHGSAFNAGASLPSSVQLQSGVSRNVSQTLGLGSNTSTYLWLSMPSNALPDQYYAPTPWQITASG
jgi:hypothetical protein